MNNNNNDSKKTCLAPLRDRFLSVAFDFLIFSPFFTISLFPLFRRVEATMYSSTQNLEFLVYLSCLIFSIFILSFFTLTLFYYYFGATPGKMIFKLKVISIQGGEKLNFYQAWTRSLFWCLNIWLLFIPLFEVFSQKQRRALHDRVAETIVVSLNQKRSESPQFVEALFVQKSLGFVLLLSLSWLSFVVFQIYETAEKGRFTRKDLSNENALCSNVFDLVIDEKNNLDHLIAYNIVDEISDDCLEKEADFVLWSEQSELVSWAYLAKGIIKRFDDEIADKYYKKVCELAPLDLSCSLAKVFLEDSSDLNERLISEKELSLTERIIYLKQDQSRGKYNKVLANINRLSQHYLLIPFLQEERIKTFWNLNEKEKAWGAYESIFPYFVEKRQRDLSSWICLEEVNENCQIKNYRSCNDLMKLEAKASYTKVEEFSAIALIKHRECKNESFPTLPMLASVFSENPDLEDLLKSIIEDSPYSYEKKMETLRDLAFSTKRNVDKTIRIEALKTLAAKTQSRNDLARLILFLKNTTDRQDARWKNIAKSVLLLADRMKIKELDSYISKRSQLKKTAQPESNIQRMPSNVIPNESNKGAEQ